MTTKDNDTSPKATRNRCQEIFSWLREEVSRERFRLLVGAVAMLTSSMANQAMPRLVGVLMDQTTTTTSSRSESSSSRMPVGQDRSSYNLLVVLCGGALASFMRTLQLRTAEASIAARLRTQAYQSLLLAKDLQWFQNTNATVTDEATVDEAQPGTHGLSPAALAEILNHDVDQVSKTLTSTFANLLRSTSAVVFSTYNMFNLNASLLAISFTVVPAVGMAATFLRKALSRTIKQQRSLASQLSTLVEERLTHVAVVKLANRERDEIATYQRLQQETLSVAKTAAWQNGIFMGFVFGASASALLWVINAGGKSVRAGRMTPGELSSFCTYSFLLGLGTSGVVKGLSEFFQGFVSAERLFQLLERTNETRGEDSGVTVDVNAIDSIAMQNVSFAFDSAPTPVLQDVSLELSRGSVLALVGKNGSGKSTIASLLADLLKPTSGKIELSDRTDWGLVEKSVKSKLVQVVLQSTSLFNMSILENVRYSQPSASVSQVKQALTEANCNEFVSKLDAGIDFVVGLNGCKLSGGQRQRLALARALLSDPAVLIMDEPLSGMDADGASAVADAIRACQQGPRQRALMLITHHEKSLALADKVLVLNECCIAETGSFDELSANPNSALCSLMPSLHVLKD